jgi:ABC-type transport system involved in cytochrome c biogenesis permease component
MLTGVLLDPVPPVVVVGLALVVAVVALVPPVVVAVPLLAFLLDEQPKAIKATATVIAMSLCRERSMISLSPRCRPR